MRSVCVFCGSRSGARPDYAAAARRTGEAIARRRWRLVYGGGRVGLMGIVADAALAAGGEVIGVIPEALAAKEIAHGGLSRLHVVASMHERKALMAELAEGFLALPGGYGTLEELFEVVTWAQLGLHRKPCALLDVAGFFAPLAAMLDRMTGEGFIDPAQRGLIFSGTDPEQVLEALAGSVAAAPVPWLGWDET